MGEELKSNTHLPGSPSVAIHCKGIEFLQKKNSNFLIPVSFQPNVLLIDFKIYFKLSIMLDQIDYQAQ